VRPALNRLGARLELELGLAAAPLAGMQHGIIPDYSRCVIGLEISTKSAVAIARARVAGKSLGSETTGGRRQTGGAGRNRS